jgi:hypothetical protein
MKHKNFAGQILGFLLVLSFPGACNTSEVSTLPPATTTTTPITIKETQTSILPTPTRTPAPIRPGDVLFFEDFEDGRADGLNYEGVNWKVVSEDTGNMVYEVNTTEDNSSPSIGFGSTTWTHYSVEYRVKALNSSADIWMNFRNSGMGYYVQRLSWEFDSVNLYFSPPDNPWEPIIESDYHSIKNTWYLIRVEVQGEAIRLYVNDNLTITETDARLAAGDIAIGNLGDTHALYDDIQVVALESISP